VATTGKESLVAGRPWVYVGNVSKPTMTVYSPKAKNTGAAVVVFPAVDIGFWPSILKAQRFVIGSLLRALRVCY
jgi:hypothetical protein